MKQHLRLMNRALYGLIAILSGILLGLTQSNSLASGTTCPIVENPIECGSGQTFSSAFAGYACGMNTTTGKCCQYHAFNIYCNEVYRGTTYVLVGDTYTGPCSNGLCLSFVPPEGGGS